MQFLFPAFLWGLSALIIPVIIHLFHFRRFRRVFFPNVRLLQAIREEKQNRSKVRKRVVLFLRMSAFSALILAFAQPFLPVGETIKPGIHHVSLFVDNSFSMRGISSEAPLFDVAKARARDIVNGFGPEDKFQVLSNASSARSGQFLSREDALDAISELEISSAFRPLSQVLTQQRKALEEQRTLKGSIFQLSDFQCSVSDFRPWQDSLFHLSLVPMKAIGKSNVSLDSAYFDSPVRLWKEKIPLLVRYRNRGDTPVENVRLSLFFEGQQRPLGSKDLQAGESRTDTVFINLNHLGKQELTLRLTDYPIQFDDTYFLSFEVIPRLEVLVISPDKPHQALRTALEAMPPFQVTFQPANRLSYDDWNKYSLIVLDELTQLSSGLASSILQYLEVGRNVFFIPSAAAELVDYNAFFQNLRVSGTASFSRDEMQVGEIDLASFPFREVYEVERVPMRLPSSKGQFRYGANSRSPEQVLMTYRDGSSFLSAFRLAEGTFYRLASPLEGNYSNLSRQPEIFVPLLYRLGIASGGNQPLAYTAGIENRLRIPLSIAPGDKIFRIKGPGGEYIPPQRYLGNNLVISLQNPLVEAGYHAVMNDRDEEVHPFAINYNRQESTMSFLRPDELRERVGENARIFLPREVESLSDAVSRQREGKPLWRWFLAAALAFLFLEGCILRWWK